MRVRYGWILVVCLAWLAETASAKVFQLAGVPVELEDVTPTTEVYYRSMRLNRATSRWNVEAVVRNTAVDPLNGPVVLLVESTVNTPGPVSPDGTDEGGLPYYDFTGRIPAGGLVTGQECPSRTLELAVGSGVPALSVRVFGVRSPSGPALAMARALNEVGQPLPGVVVEVVGPSGTNEVPTGAGSSVATLGNGAGTNVFKFSAPGYLPVWRRDTLVPGAVRVLAAPRLTPSTSHVRSVGPLGGVVSNDLGSVQVTIPPGALAADATLGLTPVTAQTLPAALPAGWSPLQAFWLESSHPPTLPMDARLELWDATSATETAALVRWNPGTLEWDVASLVSGNGSSVAQGQLQGAGAWALVVPDAGTGAPPAAVAGQPLTGAAHVETDYLALSAVGRVSPSTSRPSRIAAEVTAMGALTVSNRMGALPSGLLLRGRVREHYTLARGVVQESAPYDTTLVAYQRPGDSLASTLQLTVPLRPSRLLGPEELISGLVTVDILPPTAFGGAVVSTNGGGITNATLSVRAGPGAVDRAQAAELDRMSVTNFAGLVSAGQEVVEAFALSIGELAAGQSLELQVQGLSPLSRYVLARVVTLSGVPGLEPVQRLHTDAAGRLSSAEPPGDPHLPGLTAAGQYVLIKVAAAQVLVMGIVQDAGGRPEEGKLVRTGPWLAVAASDGAYRLLAEAGGRDLEIVDPLSGSSLVRSVMVADQLSMTGVDLAWAVQGPQVIGVSPAGGATNVSVVTIVTVQFNGLLDPATVSTNSVRLLGSGGAGVPVGVGLNLRGDVLTVLPEAPLAASTVHRLVVSTNLLGRSGLPVVGGLDSAFTTAGAAFVRSPGAQLRSYEPTNGLARLEGTGGFAEPGQPVILVNETTGRTLTVLADPDGSFGGSVAASTDDVLSITTVNSNGARNSLRVARQMFADGSVALSEEGGTLEAVTEAGPMELIMDPGSLAGKTRLKIEPVAAADLMAAVSNVPPQNATLLAGFRLELMAGGMKSGAHVAYPVSEASLNLAPGDSPTNHVFALVEAIELEGQVVYRVADTMQWEEGRLVTHSPPFEGLMPSFGGAMYALAMLPFAAFEKTVAIGFVAAVPESQVPYMDEPTLRSRMGLGDPTVMPLPGATVYAYPGSSGWQQTVPGVNPGMFVARANSLGFFSLLVPFNPLADSHLLLVARSSRLPTLSGLKVVAKYAFSPVMVADVVVPLPEGPAGADTFPPSISAVPPSAVLPVGTNVDVTFILRDNLTAPRLVDVEFVQRGSVDAETGNPMDPFAILQTNVLSSTALDPTAAQVVVRFEVTRAGLVPFRITAEDRGGNRSEVVLTFAFGTAASPGPIPPAEPGDVEPPRVVGCNVGEGTMLAPGAHIDFLLSEAVRPASTNGAAISGSALLRCELVADQRVLRAWPGALLPGTNYTLTLNSQVVDISTNALDQDPSTPGLDPFLLRFTTPPATNAILPGAADVVGSVVFGRDLLTLDRVMNGDSRILVHRLETGYPLKNSITVPPNPRAMVLIPEYSFVRRRLGTPETKPLLAVVGGTAGGGGTPMWMRIFDLSEVEDWRFYSAPIGGGLAPGFVGGGLLSMDPSAVAVNLRFSAPRLAIQLMTPNGGVIDLVNLQAFILGANMVASDWEDSPSSWLFVPGADNNNDGDYVDADETLPWPQINDLFGLESAVTLPNNRDIVDFWFGRAGADILVLCPSVWMGTNVLPSRLQVLLLGGEFVGSGGDSTGALEFPATSGFPSNTVFRVALDLDFPVPDATGTRELPVALVSGGDLLRLVDLSIPETPRLLAQFRLPNDPGTIFSIQRSGDDEYTFGTAKGLWAVKRSEMLSAGVAALGPFTPLPLSGRGFAADAFHFAGASGVPLQVALRPPKLSVVSAPGITPTNSAGILAGGLAAVTNFVAHARVMSLLEPTALRDFGPNCPQGLMPPSESTHYYALVEMPGEVGATVDLAVESLDARGRLLAPQSTNWPPVLLSGQVRRTALADEQPDVTALVARRLSTNAASPLYNLYLSDPFVLVREPLSQSNTVDLLRIPGRQAIWSGQSLRFSFDAVLTPPEYLKNLISTIPAPLQLWKPGLSWCYWAIPGDFTDNPNPSLPASPNVAGVNLQSGAFRTQATDHFVPGRLQPLALVRSYDSRTAYFGPFGRGWDFNWNSRILEIPAETARDLCLTYYGDASLDRSAREQDALWMNGNGGMLLFKRISPEAGNTNALPAYASDPAIVAFGWTNSIGTYYESPQGEFGVLYRFKSGPWVLVGTDGARTYFTADGRLDRVVGGYEASQQVCRYRADGRLDEVVGDRNISIRFGYYQSPGASGTTPYDRVASANMEVGRIARTQVKAITGILKDVSYSYDRNGNLVKSTDPNHVDTLYGYDLAAPHQLTSVGRGSGADAPAQKIFYRDGLVTKIVQDNKEILFSGARETAADRFATPSEQLSVTQPGASPARYTVDNRGRPTDFANLPQAADDAGRMTKASDTETSVLLSYDTTNAVHRFRGNLIGSEQEGRPAFKASYTYDQSAWNRILTTTAVDGVVTSNRYVVASGYVQQIIETVGPVSRTNWLDDHGQLLKVELGEGDHTLITTTLYDPTSQLAAGEQRGSLAAARFTPNLLGLVQSFRAGAGLDFTAGYNADGQPMGMSNTWNQLPDLTLAYDQGSLKSDSVSRGTNEVGHTYTYDPGDSRHVQTVTSTESGLPDLSTTFAHDVYGRLKSVTDGSETTTVDYDGVLATNLHGPGFSRQVAYSGRRPVAITEQGVTLTLGYDTQDRVVTLTQQGATTTLAYNLAEQVRSKTLTDTNGTLLEEQYFYDGAGRLSELRSGAESRQFEYFADDALRRVFLGGTLVMEAERDDAGRVTKTAIPGVAEQLFEDEDPQTAEFRRETSRLYSSNGGMAYRAFVVDRTYDLLGRPLTEDRPCGRWSYEYDAFGHSTRRMDPDSVEVERTFSPSGIVLATRFSDGSSAVNTYDAQHRLTGVGAMGNTYTGPEMQLSQVIWADGTLSQFADYNAYGMPETIVHGGVLQRHTYAEGRLAEISSGPDTVRYTYDGLGRLRALGRNTVSSRLDYNAQGQMDGQSLQFFSEPQLQWRAVFTNQNRLVGEQYPSGILVDWQTSPLGLPTGAPNLGIDHVEWMGAGCRVAMSYAGGLRAVHDYDDSLRLVGIRYLTGPLATPTTNAAFLYQLTPGGRVVSENRPHEGRHDVYRRNSNLEGMRLTDVFLSALATNGSGAVGVVQGFAFDPNGDILAPTNAAGADDRALCPPVVQVDGHMQSAGGFPVHHDARGSVDEVPLWVRLPGATNLTPEAALLRYDGLGLVYQVERGSGAGKVTVSYTRDAFGNIVQRDVAGPADRCHPGSRRYVWRGRQLIEEYDLVQGVYELLRRYFYLETQMVLVQAASVPGGVLRDYVPMVSLNGSVGGYLEPTGALTEAILYGPYGVPVFRQPEGTNLVEAAGSLVGATLLFQGAWFDEETGLYQVGERNLHPVLARFLQRDSQMYAVSRAMFTAFNGDPASETDPTGAEPSSLALAWDFLKPLTKPLGKVKDDGVKFSEAAVAEVKGKPRKETALLTSGLGLTKSLLEFAAAANGGESMAAKVKKTTGMLDNLKTGAGMVQTLLDWRKDRQLLTAIKANTLPMGRATFSARWLAAGGSLSGLASLDAHVLENKAFKSSAAVRGLDLEGGFDHNGAARDSHLLKRQGHLLGLGQGAASLAGSFIKEVYGTKGYGVDTANRVLGASKGLLDVAGAFHKAQTSKELAGMGWELSEFRTVGGWTKLYGTAEILSKTYDAAYATTKHLTVLLAGDPTAARARQKMNQMFDDNGGYTAAIGGAVLQKLGKDEAAYRFQTFMEDGGVTGYGLRKLDQAYNSLFVPDTRMEFYERGMSAP